MAIMDILIKNTKDRTDYTQYSLGSLSPTGEGVLGGKVGPMDGVVGVVPTVVGGSSVGSNGETLVFYKVSVCVCVCVCARADDKGWW